MTDHAAVLQDQLRQIRLVDGIQDTPYTRAIVAAIAALAAPAGCVVDWPNDWPPIETAIAAYVGEFEWYGEDEEGREGTYTPNDWQRAMVADAINGLFDDDDFRAAWLAAAPKVSEAPGLHAWGDCGCGRPAEYEATLGGYACNKYARCKKYTGCKDTPQADPAPAVAVERFDFNCSYDGGGPADEELAEDGQYVRYADHARIVAELREEVAKWRTDATEIANGAGALVQAAEQHAEAMAGALADFIASTGDTFSDVRELRKRAKALLTGQATPEGA